MFQPHSILWHYLWVAPNLLLAVLASVLWKRGLHRELRWFFIYAWFEATQWAILYPMDLIGSIRPVNYWRVYSGSLVIESVIVFFLISDVFAEVFGQYAALAYLGKVLIRSAGAILLISATAIGALAPIGNRNWMVAASQILLQGMYIVVTGLILLLLSSAAYFHLAWDHKAFGITLGLGLSSCVHLATMAIVANGWLRESGPLLGIVNMATSHVVVLMWFYYLLIPEKLAAKFVAPLPENNLALWNRELEHLLQQ